MKTHRFRGIVWLVGCLGCAVLADESVDSPTREVLNFYPYQPEVVARPATPSAPAAASNPEVTPAFTATARDALDYYGLQAALEAEAAREPSALFIWNLPRDFRLEALGRPSLRELTIPWSPMTTATDATFSAESINSSISKLQARVSLLNLGW